MITLNYVKCLSNKFANRWVCGVLLAGDADCAWVQHFIHQLASTELVGFVLYNGSMSSNQSGGGEIRETIIKADLVDCMVARPGQYFYTSHILAFSSLCLAA